MKPINFEPITMRVNATHRGGGIEIDLTTLGFPGERMAAYQNYLGGGLLGAVGVNDTIRRQSLRGAQSDKVNKKLDAIGDQLKRYYHSLTNPDPDEQPWESMTYERNQAMPERGY